MIFILQLRGTIGEPRWMDTDGEVTAYLGAAKQFTAIPAACQEAFFVIDPILPSDIWERWMPYFFMNTFDDTQGLPFLPPVSWRRFLRRVRRSVWSWIS